jgi:hypothetical protein
VYMFFPYDKEKSPPGKHYRSSVWALWVEF